MFSEAYEHGVAFLPVSDLLLCAVRVTGSMGWFEEASGHVYFTFDRESMGGQLEDYFCLPFASIRFSRMIQRGNIHMLDLSDGIAQWVRAYPPRILVASLLSTRHC